MPRHDSIFKRLLRSFLADLLSLAVPDLAARLDLAHPVLLDKEFFTTGGRRREVDLLAEVPILVTGAPPLLVHVEVEARARPDMGRRLWRYRKQIQAAHDGHVLSIVLYLQRGKAGRQVMVLDEHLLGADLADFRYVALGIEGCDPEEYLGRPEPLAWGLAALMRKGALRRPALKLACMRRIAAARLGEAQKILLVDCVEAYLELNSNEAAEYAGLCAVRENREVKAMAMTWSERIEAKGMEKGMEKGIEKGLAKGMTKGMAKGMQKVLLSLLEQRFGPLPEETRTRVEAIASLDRLTRLSERVLTARSLASLRLS
jgi:predicted transposase YdaD